MSKSTPEQKTDRMIASMHEEMDRLEGGIRFEEEVIGRAAVWGLALQTLLEERPDAQQIYDWSVNYVKEHMGMGVVEYDENGPKEVH